MGPVTALGVHLVAGRDRSADIEAWARAHGGRVGLDGVLADLNRTAREVFNTGSAATWAFAWDDEDNDSERWWPQGITSSADADPGEGYAGRRLLLTTSYSKTVDQLNKGCRITVVEVSEEQPIRYRHVLLVAVGLDDVGRPELRPVHAHAGGAVWSGSYLHVAATTSGVHTFHLDDIMAVPSEVGLGHGYVLPLRTSWAARTAEGAKPMRYSFLSLHRDGAERRLLAGEYGNGRESKRLVTYPLAPDGLLDADETGSGGPHPPDPRPVEDAGRGVRGRPPARGDQQRQAREGQPVGRRARGAAPGREGAAAGPEDITYWPSREELWTVTEYPGRRLVLALDRRRFT